MGVEPREGRRGWGRQWLPEPFDGFMIEAVARFARDHPPQFSIVQAPVQAFQTLQFLHGRGRDLPPALPRAHCDMGRKEAQHPRLRKASFELAERVGMERRVGRPLRRGACVHEERANDLRGYPETWVGKRVDLLNS